MSFSAIWKVLDQLIADLRKRKVVIPIQIMNDLKSAKTLITILKVESNRDDTILKIKEYLRNVESYLISEGQKKFGKEYSKSWLIKLHKAAKDTSEEKPETTFVPGIPKENKWVRVKTSPELTAEKLRTISKELGLSSTIQNGSFLVHGTTKNVKKFVKRISKLYRLKEKSFSQ